MGNEGSNHVDEPEQQPTGKGASSRGNFMADVSNQSDQANKAIDSNQGKRGGGGDDGQNADGGEGQNADDGEKKQRGNQMNEGERRQ